MSRNTITLSQACDGLVRYKQATGKSEHTVSDYRVSFKKLALFFPSDPLFSSITRKQMIDFFAWLQDEYVSIPDGVAPRGRIKLSAKTIFNIHTNLSALWTWGVNEKYVKQNIIRTIDKPPVSQAVVEPLTREEIEKILDACSQGRTWKTATITSARSTSDRDRAIILTLLDTGIRASELVDMRYMDVNMQTNTIRVKGKGPGRDAKERIVHIGKRTAQAIWKNLLPRINDIRDDDPIFVSSHDNFRPLDRNNLRKLLSRLGEKTGIRKVHPHRFRHTFAINFLRNGGGEFTLQTLLGHSDLEMTRRYSRIANTDTQKDHRRASPVDNWKL